MLNASQASCRNEWLTVLLWDLGGLKGRRVAPNMGKKNWLIDHIYFVFFCTGCQGFTDQKLYLLFLLCHQGEPEKEFGFFV